jgi:predicted nuclease with TOPRIM domain
LQKRNITAKDVEKAANELATAGMMPTQRLVRNILGSGSSSTIQKYLNRWKLNCFNQEAGIQPTNKSDLDVADLKTQLNRQIKQNEHYAAELINAEKQVINLKQENIELAKKNDKLTNKVESQGNQTKTLNKLCQSLTEQIDLTQNNTIAKQTKIIDQLQEEIKTINQNSLKAIQDASHNQHELLMQEKVMNINLQAKVDSLQKELSQTKQDLKAKVQTLQAKQQSLLKQLERQTYGE